MAAFHSTTVRPQLTTVSPISTTVLHSNLVISEWIQTTQASAGHVTRDPGELTKDEVMRRYYCMDYGIIMNRRTKIIISGHRCYLPHCSRSDHSHSLRSIRNHDLLQSQKVPFPRFITVWQKLRKRLII